MLTVQIIVAFLVLVYIIVSVVKIYAHDQDAYERWAEEQFKKLDAQFKKREEEQNRVYHDDDHTSPLIG